HASQRRIGNGLLPDPGQPPGGAGRAGRDLIRPADGAEAGSTRARRLGSTWGKQRGNTMGTRGLVRGLVAALLLSCGHMGSADAAALVPVENFVARQTFDNPRISSDGSYVAVSADLGDDYHGIMVFSLADMSQTAFIKLPRYEMPIEIYWVSDTRLVYVRGGKWGAREEPYDFGEIIAMD